MELLPNLYSGGTKPTNAVVLAKAGEYIRELCDRKQNLDNDLQTVKDEIQRLNNKIRRVFSIGRKVIDRLLGNTERRRH